VEKHQKTILRAAAVIFFLCIAGYYLFQPGIPFEKQKPAVGESAPDFFVIDFNGRTVQFSDVLGKVVLLNFWASWCAPCRDEMPGFQNVFLTYRDKGFRVIAVAMSDPEPLPMVKELGLVFPVTWPNEQINRDYGNVTHLPVSFLISKDGRIIKKVIGAYSEAVLRSDVEQALK
jgi:thiol-disulfide isomerase/thioredoxin